VVLICIIKDFETQYSINRDVAINSLHQVFTAFDNLQHNMPHVGAVLEKVKSSGEQYIAFARREDECNDPTCCAVAICSLAKAMTTLTRGMGVNVQIGIASGEVCACVVGTKKYQYDIYSSAVNMAARLSTVACTNIEILCQKEVAHLFQEHRNGDRGKDSLMFTSAGNKELKGIGRVEVFQLTTLSRIRSSGKS